MEVKVIVEDAHVNPATGHVTYTVFSRSTEGNSTWDGPKKQYGVDAQALRDRFNGNLEDFEAWVVSEHRSLHGAHPDFVQKVMERKGKEIG